MKIVVHLDTFIHEIQLPTGPSLTRAKAQQIAREGIWIGDTLFPPHRINSIEIERA